MACGGRPGPHLQGGGRAARKVRAVLPLNAKLVNCVQIKPRPLCWLDLQGLTRLQSHTFWRSGDAAGLDQLWDELEVEGLPLATAQSLLLQIVRLKARHFAGA